MFVDAALTWDEAARVDPARFGAVAVIDVLRATTTMLAALENGAAGVVPVAAPEEAFEWRRRRPDVLLGGERGAVRIAGFDLGNSPLEYAPETVRGKLVVLTTTNGTRAFRQVLQTFAAAGSGGSGPPEGPDAEEKRAGPAVLAACLRNAAAAAAALAREARRSGRGVLLVCSGTDGRFSREDAYCAGVIVRHLERLENVRRGDGADAAVRLLRPDASALEELSSSFHGRRLLALGLERDIEFCAATDVSAGVPRLVSGMLVLAGNRGSCGE